MGSDMPRYLDDLAEKAFAAKVWGPWRELAEKHAGRTGLPVSWVLGVIFAESQGNPNAKSRTGALGLMQINFAGLRKGLTDAQVLDPDTNVRIGTDYLRELRGFVDDLPSVASMYNAGPKGRRPKPSNANAWGFVEDAGYIDRVVAANNTAIKFLGGRQTDDTTVPLFPIFGVGLLLFFLS
jgi:soluble lytic murein transglycosylase-like protein